MDEFVFIDKGTGDNGPWMRFRHSTGVIWTFWKKLAKASAKPQKGYRKGAVLDFSTCEQMWGTNPKYLFPQDPGVKA